MGGGNNPLVLLEKQNPRVDKRSGGGSGGYHTESVGLIGQQGGETSLRNSICTDLFYCVVLINLGGPPADDESSESDLSSDVDSITL